MNIRALTTLTVAAAISIFSSSASATFPGTNGLVAMIGAQIQTEDEQGNRTCSFEDPYDIYTMNADGSDMKRLYDAEDYVTAVAWSVDGDRIAFTENGLFTVAADGSDVRSVVDDRGTEGDPTWSPKGRIAYSLEGSRTLDIYSVRADGTGKKRLTSHTADDRLPSWSPDGRRIVFVSTRRGGGEDIYTMNARGSDMKRLTTDVTVMRRGDRKRWGGVTTVGWSPDSDWIYFEANRGDGATVIYKMRKNGSDKTKLQEGAHPVWSPDGTTIFFLEEPHSGERCHEKLYQMSPDGSNVQEVETRDDVEFYRMDWQAG